MGYEVNDEARLRLETRVSDLMLLAQNLEDLTLGSHAPRAIKVRLNMAAARIREACNDWERLARKPEAPPWAPHPAQGCIKHSELRLLDSEGNCPECMEAE